LLQGPYLRRSSENGYVREERARPWRDTKDLRDRSTPSHIRAGTVLALDHRMMKRPWRTFLVPHDFSASANHAAAIARDEAKLHDGRLVLLHVVELPPFGHEATLLFSDDGAPPLGMREYATRKAEAHLEDLARRLVTDGVPTTTVVRVGNPVDEINQFVADSSIDVIVMGTHGHTGVRRLVAGSVTERVVRTATVPVITTRHPD
jgi:nucleotide-binding universal stress UspA family protein